MIDALSTRDYRLLAELLEKRVGIRLPPAKRTMVEGRLRRRVRNLNLPDLETYCRRLFDQGGLADEIDFLIDAITTNKTDFFREPEHFAFLQREAVPSLLADRLNRRIKIWSAGCSNGAEPYTQAMVLSEMMAQWRFQFAILGTDICNEVLEQAVLGIYPSEMLAPVPPNLASRYVMWSRDRQRRTARIIPELRRLVRFMRLNLMDATYPLDRDVDVVFCRNVLIYFDAANQRAVIERLCGHLRHGGYLFLGHSDCLGVEGLSSMRQVAVAVFQRQ